ncbi:hypothetical protein TNCV_4403651 [Trichonephila clavipes]|uniref:Uncharacterized protein n=1 Tax=Trichonephila clavipes TaxID=2585209 RepID=A0A8X6S6I4_TRICX|nr:hypothetical protein TNCV_4403651 [Trichonephila clavipes]
MSLEQIWAARLWIVWAVLKFDEVMLSCPTPRPSSHPLSSCSFHKRLPYNNLDQVTAEHGTSIVTTEFVQSAASFLEELSRITTLKTSSGNREWRANNAREPDKCRRSGFHEGSCQGRS